MTFHRMTALFLVCLLTLAFSACTDSEKDADGDNAEDGDNSEDGDTPPDGDADEETPLPEGCEELLAPSDTPVDCAAHPDFESRCQVARDNPEIVFAWIVSLSARERDEREHHRNCLAAYMVRTKIPTGPTGYRTVEPLFHLGRIIRSIVPYCNSRESWPCDCCAQSLDTCTSPFCHVLRGAKVYQDEGCIRSTPAACVDWETCCGVGEAESPAPWLDPDGNCWEFHTTCTPRPQLFNDQCDHFFWGDGALPWCEE